MAVNSDGEHVYCWQRDGRWRVGTVARDVTGDNFAKLGSNLEAQMLMRVHDDLEWVATNLLQPYPAEPIPEPEVSK
jgi:hypothetical protein